MPISSKPISELTEPELRLALAEARMEITVLKSQVEHMRVRLGHSSNSQRPVDSLTSERRSTAPSLVPGATVYLPVETSHLPSR